MTNNYGLTDERYIQMMQHYNGNKDLVRCIVEEWGADKCNAGYCIVADNLPGNHQTLHVERIDAVAAFASDREAALHAAQHGIPLIPESDLKNLPASVQRTAWVDEPGTRTALRYYAAFVKNEADREQQVSELKGNICSELLKIQQAVEQLRNRTLRIPIRNADLEAVNDFYRKVISLKFAAHEAAIYRII